MSITEEADLSSTVATQESEVDGSGRCDPCEAQFWYIRTFSESLQIYTPIYCPVHKAEAEELI